MVKFNSKHVSSLYAVVIFGLIGFDLGSLYPEYELSEFAIPAVLTVSMLIMLGIEFRDFQERLFISIWGSIMIGVAGATSSVYGHEFAHSAWLITPIFATAYATVSALFLIVALVCGRQLKKVVDRTLKDRFAPRRG